MTVSTKNEANLILNQLTASQNGTRKLYAMVGSRQFAFDSSKAPNVNFRFQGSEACNHVNIQLNGADLYNMTFNKIQGFDIQQVKHFENVYCDSLLEIFESETGLYLNF